MKRRTAFPFATLPDEVVSFRGWMIGDPGQPLLPATDTLENWDYERDLEISADVEIDLATSAEALGVEKGDLELLAVLRAGTGAGTLPRRLDLVATDRIDIESQSCSLTAVLPSHTLSGRLRLELGLVLGRANGQGSALAPQAPGSRLWGSSKDILIEDGGAARFPIELVSFSECFPGMPHVHAPWYVDWKPGHMHADFGGSVRLYVNSDIPDVAERFADGDPLTLQSILADVMSQMVTAAVHMDDAEELLSESTDGTVGQQIMTWLDLALPGQGIGAVRSMSEHLPGRFRAALLAASDTGDVV
ncbi:MAG: hypothetical protein AAFQ85_00640 [Pseudomonadota bacterium]